jgi:hypothetical protein
MTNFPKEYLNYLQALKEKTELTETEKNLLEEGGGKTNPPTRRENKRGVKLND